MRTTSLTQPSPGTEAFATLLAYAESRSFSTLFRSRIRAAHRNRSTTRTPACGATSAPRRRRTARHRTRTRSSASSQTSSADPGEPAAAVGGTS